MDAHLPLPLLPEEVLIIQYSSLALAPARKECCLNRTASTVPFIIDSSSTLARQSAAHGLIIDNALNV